MSGFSNVYFPVASDWLFYTKVEGEIASGEIRARGHARPVAVELRFALTRVFNGTLCSYVNTDN